MAKSKELEPYIDSTWHTMSGEGVAYPKTLQTSGPFVWSAPAILYGKKIQMSDRETTQLAEQLHLVQETIRITALDVHNLDPVVTKGAKELGTQLAFSLREKESNPPALRSKFYPGGSGQRHTIAINFDELDKAAMIHSKSPRRDRMFFWAYSDVFQYELEQGLKQVYFHELQQHADVLPEVRRAALEALNLSLTGLTWLAMQIANFSQTPDHRYNPELGAASLAAAAGIHVLLSGIVTLMPIIERLLKSRADSTSQDLQYLADRIQEYGLQDIFLPAELQRTFLQPLRMLQTNQTPFIRPKLE